MRLNKVNIKESRISTNLMKARQQKDITIKSAAGYIGISVKLMEYLEKHPNDLSISELAMLSELYEVELKTLYN